MNTCRPSTIIAIVLLNCFTLCMEATSTESPALLQASGVRGGLGLVIGAETPDLSEALAAQSSLYFQVLQPEWNTAMTMGRRFAKGPHREKLAVRHAAFDPAHYDVNLLNLVVVEDPAALGKAKAADLFRILVPNGVVAFAKEPVGFAAAADSLKMKPVDIEGYVGFRKPVLPPVWKLPLSHKWSAGPRSHIARGFTGFTFGDGKVYYVERMELNRGDLNAAAAMLFARDAYNGRTHWTTKLPGGFNDWSGRSINAVATKDGHLLVRAGSPKVIRIDGATGKILSDFIPKLGKSSRIRRINDDLLWVSGKVYSMETGKQLWKFPFKRYQPLPHTKIGKTAYFCDGTTLTARNLADGKQLWAKPLPKLPGPYHSLTQMSGHLLVRSGGGKDTFNISGLNHEDGTLRWSYSWKIRIAPKERYFHSGKVRMTAAGPKLLLYYRHNKMTGGYADEFVVTRLDLATGKEEVKDKVLTKASDFHGCFGELQLGDYIAWYDLWVDKNKLETTLNRMPHPACFFGSKTQYGLVFNWPSRKAGPITAVAPADETFKKEPSDQPFVKTEKVPSTTEPVSEGWPMFRANTSGGNFTASDPGADLQKAWEVSLGLGGKDFGIMCSERTGLTQAVVGYGMAFVCDIDAQRVIAVDAKTGATRWVFPVGSRIEFSPSLHKGRCLFAAKNGWVYCLDAKTGALLWKRLVAPQERFIGGWDKLESRWAVSSDVLLVKGTGFVKGGFGTRAFNAETGELSDAKYPPRELGLSHYVVTKGNSMPRNLAENVHAFRMKRYKRNLQALVLAFDKDFTVAYKFHPNREVYVNKGSHQIFAVSKDPKKPVWRATSKELIVDDMVLTPKHVYCVGHYQRVKKDPELWILSRKDGSVVKTLPFPGFPGFLGMSAAGKRLLIATREGKLICYQGE